MPGQGERELSTRKVGSQSQNYTLQSRNVCDSCDDQADLEIVGFGVGRSFRCSNGDGLDPSGWRLSQDLQCEAQEAFEEHGGRGCGSALGAWEETGKRQRTECRVLVWLSRY